MVPVAYVFAYFLGALALALIFPAAVAASVGEAAQIPDFLITSALLIFISGALMLSLRGRERRLRPAERYLLALLLWVLLPVFAALPLIFSIDGLSPLNAYFEAVSGLTTTGATVLPPPERLPMSIVLWLSLIQWLGGALTLLVVVLVLAPTGVGGLPEAHARMIEHGGLPERRRLLLILRDVMPIYAGATLLCFVLITFAGVDPFEALCLSFASVATGGFAPRSGELAGYLPSAAIIILMIFMLYGATSVLWHRDVLRRRWVAVAGHRESWWVVMICLVAGFIAGVTYYLAAGGHAPLAMRDGLFTAVSLVTTTGLEVRNASFEVFPYAMVALLVSLGAASFSTGGGIKFFRIGAMLIQSGRELNRLVYPHAVRPARFGSQSEDIQVMKAVWSGFLAFVGAATLLSLMIAGEGVPYEGAFLAALSALSNAGPVYSSNWDVAATWPTYAELGPWIRLALCAGMVLGRLEIIAVLGLAVFAYRRG